MHALYHWFWRLIPANPLTVRIVQGGSRRMSHLWMRMGYLGVLIVLLLIGLLLAGGMGSSSLTDLAKAGTKIFAVTSYGQVLLICLIAPLFMAGAITQEQSGQTYDILLTTPLSNLQIVLGSLLGRLFFVWMLLASGLPLFSVLLLFGGVPISSVFVAFAVAALAALVVGSVAVALSVTRVGGRKSVFIFIISVAVYLLGGYALDQGLRAIQPGLNQTTLLTPLHPLLVLESFLNTANYRPPSPDTLTASAWPVRLYLGQPLAAFALLSSGGSFFLLFASAWWVRGYGSDRQAIILAALARVFRLGGASEQERVRPARTVWHNPIAWQEAHTRANRLTARLGRAGFVLLALLLAVGLILLYHFQYPHPFAPVQPFSAQDLRAWLLVLLWIELAVVSLVAIYMSAGSVSREREDGTLDLLLTTPITPRQYLWGKLRGLVSFLAILLSAPVLTLAIFSTYILLGMYFQWPQIRCAVSVMNGNQQANFVYPLILPEAALLWPLMLIPFTAFCAAVGMQWSLKARGVLGAVVPTLAILAGLSLFLGFCGVASARNIPFLGSIINAASPTTNLLMLFYPWDAIAQFNDNPLLARFILGVSAVLVALVYGLGVYAMIQTMVRSFDHTVRRLSGTTN